MTPTDKEAAANAAGWVVAGIVAIVAVCAVTFMITTQPKGAPELAQSEQTLRGIYSPSTLDAEIARAQADQAARLAQASAANAQAAASAAAGAAQAANDNAVSAADAAADASDVVPAVPPDLDIANPGAR